MPWCNIIFIKIRFDSKSLSYQPHDREWLKARVLQSFMKMASGI